MSDSEKEPPELPLPLHPEVGLVVQYPNGATMYRLDPFLRDMQWPNIRTASSAFRILPPHDRLYEQSRAFLRAAIALCEQAGESERMLDWPQASVCYYCLHLATELFLKACILRVGHKPAKSHEITDFLHRYEQLLPGEDNQFPTPWALSARDLDEALGVEVLRGVDRLPDQLFRYGMDKRGTASAGIQFFAPGYFFNYTKYLDGKWQRIWANAGGRDDG